MPFPSLNLRSACWLEPKPEPEPEPKPKAECKANAKAQTEREPHLQIPGEYNGHRKIEEWIERMEKNCFAFVAQRTATTMATWKNKAEP